MTDRQTDRQTDRHTNIRNNNKAHSLRDVTQKAKKIKFYNGANEHFQTVTVTLRDLPMEIG